MCHSTVSHPRHDASDLLGRAVEIPDPAAHDSHILVTVIAERGDGRNCLAIR